jgi:hypothetical protein
VPEGDRCARRRSWCPKAIGSPKAIGIVPEGDWARRQLALCPKAIGTEGSLLADKKRRRRADG